MVPMLYATTATTRLDHIRANLSHLRVDTARHLHSGGFVNRALAGDLAEAGKLIPNAGLGWLALQLPEVTPELASQLAAEAAALQLLAPPQS